MLITKSGSKWGAYFKEKPFPQNCQTRYSPFTDCMLLGLSWHTIFTPFECIGDLNEKGFSGGMGDGFRRTSEFNMKVIDILLG